MTDATPQPGDRIPSLDPAAEVVARLDALSDASRDAPQDQSALTALWRAVLGLERWILIARGTPEQPRPFAVSIPQGPVLLVFSTAERARVGGMAAGLTQEEASRLIATPLPAAIEWAASFQAVGVVGIALDHGTTGAWTPLANLVPMRDHFAANPA
ncbi:hypothetical protein [Agrococcus jejuensis]|uniref:SseB protein N-terminal domain-containing protein n=1 Tax=Agrococcus jejuensis TaxID=399736 RepID=A0A1G8H799_9MICO|nr:hypothetical protein [Agrococcus jejuensis]SDI02512.1 hypothetical protein SAMN04489720_3246 [Agrococcus jejuensis]